MRKSWPSSAPFFDGKLGCHPHKKIKVDIPPGAQPIKKRLYPIPYRQEIAFKREMEEMVDDRVLRRKDGVSECASPTFVVPREDKRIRIVSSSERSTC